MTALSAEDEPKRIVLPTTRFRAGPPVWEIRNDPISGMRNDTWFIYIDESAKMMGMFEGCAFVDENEVPIVHGIELDAEDERVKFTPERWVDYAKPIAEKYLSALNTIQEAGSAGLRSRSHLDWAESLTKACATD